MAIRRSTSTSTGKGSSAAGRPDLKARIEKKAYEIFARRGYTHGNDMDDWLQAEREVKRELSR